LASVGGAPVACLSTGIGGSGQRSRPSVNTESAVTEVAAETQKILWPAESDIRGSYRTDAVLISAVRYSTGRTHYPQ